MAKVFRKPPEKPEPKAITNELIRAPEVRVISETGENLGLMPTSQAIALAKEKGLTLIQIAQTSKETVTKIVDLGKYLYLQQKAEKKQREKQRKDTVKIIRLKLSTQLHDLKIKAQQARKFLEQGYRVQLEIILKGREKAQTQEAEKKLTEFVQLLEIKTKILQQKQGPRGSQLLLGKG